MKILWAEKMVNEVNGSYESYISDPDNKMMVRIYLDEKKGINDFTLKRVKKMKPKNFVFVGIFWCRIEKKMYLLFSQI